MTAVEDLPLVSVVMETANGAEEGLTRALDALRGQSYPAGRVQTIVVVGEDDEALAPLRAARSDAEFLAAPDASYFEMKHLGVAPARGEILAFLDSDCEPSRDWVRELVETIRAGADVSVGRTRYAAEGRAIRVADAFAWSHLRGDRAGRAAGMGANNVAFRAEVYADVPWDQRLRRSGGCYLMTRSLRARGYRMDFNPRQLALHRFSPRQFVNNRVRSGYDAVRLPGIDAGAVLPETARSRLGPAAPLGTLAARVGGDALRLWRRPGLLPASVAVRSLEAVGGALALVRPELVEEHFDE